MISQDDLLAVLKQTHQSQLAVFGQESKSWSLQLELTKRRDRQEQGTDSSTLNLYFIISCVHALHTCYWWKQPNSPNIYSSDALWTDELEQTARARLEEEYVEFLAGLECERSSGLIATTNVPASVLPITAIEQNFEQNADQLIASFQEQLQYTVRVNTAASPATLPQSAPTAALFFPGSISATVNSAIQPKLDNSRSAAGVVYTSPPTLYSAVGGPVASNASSIRSNSNLPATLQPNPTLPGKPLYMPGSA